MKKVVGLLALLLLAGCAVTPAARSGPQAGVGPRYDYQLEVVYTDGATPFLHLVEAQDP